MDNKFLNFFDKYGNNLNPKYNEDTGIWEGKIYVPRISINLYESSNIFISELFVKSNGHEVYGLPQSRYGNTSTTGTSWIAYWENDKTTAFELYQFELQDKPILKVLNEIEIELDNDINNSVLTTGQLQSDNIVEDLIQLNIYLMSDYEDEYERTLIIKDIITNKIIAKFEFYGETVAQDERLPQNLNLLGLNLDPEEYKVFRDSDINEALPDNDFLNNKMVELLIEARNIKPFIGTYKGLINVIKYYGYNNIQIKEYWLNVDKNSTYYGKYRTSIVKQVFDENVDFNDNTYSLPNKQFKKTNLFSLIYKINNLTGVHDKYDMPEVEETSEFTMEEVLIKLYGLKSILTKKWLSSTSKIRDIVGEGDYFGNIQQTVWIDQNRIEKIDEGINPCFRVFPSNIGFITDLRKIYDLIWPYFQTYMMNNDFSELVNNTDITLNDIKNILVAYFENYTKDLDEIIEFLKFNNIDYGEYIENIKPFINLPDQPHINLPTLKIAGTPAGYPICIQNCSFDMIWNNANVNWNELTMIGNLVFDFSFDNINFNIPTVFSIIDKISGKSISVNTTQATGSTYNAKIHSLLVEFQNQFNAGINNNENPWKQYEVSIVGNSLRVRQLFSKNVNCDFVPYTNFSYTFDPTNKKVIENKKFIKTFPTGTTMNTWETYGMGNFYELRWRIWKPITDTPAFEYVKQVSLGEPEAKNLVLVLPYAGKYSVELQLYDTFNHISQELKTDYIEVLNKNVEFVGFYKYREPKYTWNSNHDINWNKYTSYWNLPIKPRAFNWEGEANYYESLNRANYILNGPDDNMKLSYHYGENHEVNKPKYTKGAYFWDNMGPGTWDEAYHLWWNSTKVSADTPASFRIYNINPGEILKISQTLPFIGSGTHIFSSNDLELAANELNSSTNPVLSKYIYNPVYQIDTNGDINVVFIQVVARHFGLNGDWEIDESDQIYGNIFGLSGSTVDIKYPNLHETNNPTWEEIKFITDSAILPKMVFVTFTYDKSKIPGKHNAKWIIRNIDDLEQNDIYFNGRWLTYLFKFSGKYIIELELTDSNGNKSIITKNMIIVK